MEIEEDGYSSSTNSSIEIVEKTDLGNISSPKMSRSSKNRKFNETPYTVFRGVRRRNESKWACEVRELDNKKSKICLGTFPTPEMAARAHEAEALAIREDKAILKRAESSSTNDIQVAALEAASMFRPPDMSFSYPSSSIDFQTNAKIVGRPSEIVLPNVDSAHEHVPRPADSAGPNEGLDPLVFDPGMFMDEEMLFNMPCFYNSMAEGLAITPPAMEWGYDWDYTDPQPGNCDMDLTLWTRD